jgi:hypothetical protein
MKKWSRAKCAVLLGLLASGGCSFGVKNIKPVAPYDFGYLNQMARYAQGAYADDAAIRALCRPAFDNIYTHTIAATDNKYFLATSTTTRVQLISIAGTANLRNVLLDADQTQEFSRGLTSA